MMWMWSLHFAHGTTFAQAFNTSVLSSIKAGFDTAKGKNVALLSDNITLTTGGCKDIGVCNGGDITNPKRNPIPEPSILALLGIGLTGMASVFSRRKKI